MNAAVADVAVVGAGVVGCSIAWHLARRGVRVLLLERESAPGLGSTGRATGGFRAQFGSEVNVRLSLLSRQKLLRFQDEVSADPGYRPCGYLWLASNQEQLNRLQAAQAIQHAAGLAEARMVAASGLARLNPAIQADGLIGGAHCPTDGFIRPLQILRGYLDAALRLGAELRCDSPVIGLRRARGLITEITTPSGDIAVGAVVDAAGAWAAPVAKLAGVELPVAPLRSQVAATIPTNALPGDMPLTIFLEDGFHLRVRDGRVLLLLPHEGEGTALVVDDAWLAKVEQLARARVPALGAVQIDRAASWAGLYELSPDRHALLGAAPGCANLFLANGSSGHGVMHAPALGQLLSEIMVDGRASALDVTALRPERFAEGRPNPPDALL